MENNFKHFLDYLTSTSIFFWHLLLRNLKTNVPPGFNISYEKLNTFNTFYASWKASLSTIPLQSGEMSNKTVLSLCSYKSNPILVFVTSFVISPLMNLLFGYVITDFSNKSFDITIFVFYLLFVNLRARSVHPKSGPAPTSSTQSPGLKILN